MSNLIPHQATTTNLVEVLHCLGTKQQNLVMHLGHCHPRYRLLSSSHMWGLTCRAGYTIVGWPHVCMKAGKVQEDVAWLATLG